LRLTKFSDYSLRVLIYLAVHPDRAVSIREMSRAYRVSPHIVVKVVQQLVAEGSVRAVRGRHGGLRLKRAPSEINVGALVRRTERTWNLVECFDPATNGCPIAPVCGLKGALERAQRAFLDVLDEQTLDDLLPRPTAIAHLLHVSFERSAPS
jgi:Rrf2 family transcriptional regulator, nitric oxide-sensitive transcriptional repressor